MPPEGIFDRISPRETASITAWRARFSRTWRSFSQRDGISGFLVTFKHAQFAALLYAVVEMTPEPMEILRGGHQRAGNDEPEQKYGRRIERRVPPGDAQHRTGANVQDQFI